MTCEGKKAFDGAWNELKEAGYLKVHMYSNGVTWTVEYELLDEPAAGAHTFYYNSKGELTKTNLERAASKSINVGSDVENDEENPEKEENFRIPPFGSNGNGSNGNRYNGNGYNGNGYNGDGSNGNGGNNNKDLITNPNFKDSDINTSIKSYPQTSKEALESQNMIDGLIESNNHYMEVIKENIKYDELMHWFDPEVRQRYDELYQIICDVVCVPRSTIRVNGKDYPYELVKSQFLKLKKEHVEYVANSMKTNLGEVKNIRSYLIIVEFVTLKKKLADYFDEKNTEDIFDYIPPQKTNQIFTPKDVVKKMVDYLEEENPGCFDMPDKTFIDPYMKSGLYITEIVKRLYQSKKIKELYRKEYKVYALFEGADRRFADIVRSGYEEASIDSYIIMINPGSCHKKSDENPVIDTAFYKGFNMVEAVSEVLQEQFSVHAPTVCWKLLDNELTMQILIRIENSGILFGKIGFSSDVTYENAKEYSLRFYSSLPEETFRYSKERLSEWSIIEKGVADFVLKEIGEVKLV